MVLERILAGKNVIITGTSRGLGAQIARTMWRHGANLLMVARSGNTLELLQDELNQSALPGQQVHTVKVDLKFPSAIDTIMSEVSRVWKRLDVLINNAAILGPVGRAWETDWKHWRETIGINLFTPVALCRVCVPWMKNSGGGKIINVSGGGATGTRPYFTAYAVAKTGLVRFTEILAAEVKGLNIQVNSIAPGALNTDMLQAVLDAGPEKAGQKEYSEALKQAKTGGTDPKLAADLCVFLACSASDGITGKLISAVWDPWPELPKHLDELTQTDIYTLRRIVPRERGKDWG
jgi:NAD(P)-dependent dehydrogenase (short-subunit alcohol dehydrogenase family)